MKTGPKKKTLVSRSHYWNILYEGIFFGRNVLAIQLTNVLAILQISPEISEQFMLCIICSFHVIYQYFCNAHYMG